MERRSALNRLLAFLMVAMAATAPMAAKASVVCTNCNDVGKIKVQCPVCLGTKFVWKCLTTKYSTGKYTSLTEPGVFCGYGSVYHPFHQNCKSSKARICCPMCISKSGVSSSGFAELDCPMCDGKGHLFSTVYIVKDPDLLSPFLLSENDSDLAAGRTGTSNVIMRHMSSEDIEDYLTVYPKSRVFTGIDSLRRYAHLLAIRNGGAARTVVVRRPLRGGRGPLAPPPGSADKKSDGDKQNDDETEKKPRSLPPAR